MNEDVKIIDTIDSYLKGNLSGEEMIAFEKELSENPEFKKIFNEQLEVWENFKIYGRRIELKKQLNIIHDEMNDNEILEYRSYKHPKIKKSFRRSINLSKLSIAASILIFLGASFFVISNYMKSLEESQSVYYKQLRRDLDKIKKFQSEILNDIHSTEAKKETNPSLQANFSGSGFAISPNGYLITSYHVVKGAQRIYVENTHTEQEFEVKVVYRDKLRDLSLLKIIDTSFSGFTHLPYIITSHPADLGEKVYTLGYPKEDIVYGEGSISSSTGFEGDTTSYQISVPVNPGNSGGPLIDEKGQIIGVISGKHMGVESAAFAIKSQYLLNLIDELEGDTLNEPIILNRHNQLKDLKRPQQLKKLKDNIFIIKVYN
ncbi:MAG: S1C family serine protease [Cytophagaceae bacterium]